ncbi:peptidoglycan editing factor PgeF [Chitinimonas sp.]|uniref:peptidoglycan editing factor PgeF n=1 Tax=Chitinimonas sp. TaxID=1934313 RepID=UPI0035AD8ABE
MVPIDSDQWLVPDWPAPARVRALVTTRQGGCSWPPFHGFNVASHVGDVPDAVAANRAMLRQHLPAEPVWLEQVHGIAAVDAADTQGVPRADAAFTRATDTVCAVMTADCLPVLFARRDGSAVAAAHAGWRGLCDGVLEATLAALGNPAELLAWLGPAIGPDAFEVGDEVRAAFVTQDPAAASAFRSAVAPGKWWCDIYALARLRLAKAGVKQVYGGGLCTVSDAERFFSYRRDKQTGRMVSLIWIEQEVAA